MDQGHPLKNLLQFQLASDATAVIHLPHTLSTLTADAFEPSSHLHKWTARTNSLIHSKDAGARWAGLCIALQTSILCKAVMLECAQSWVTAALSLLSKNEIPPVVKACIRLLRHIFTAAAGVPEFQRQVSTPNIPKFSTALIALAEKSDDMELKIISLNTLSHVLINCPSLYRALQSPLSSLALRYLNGSSPKPVPDALLEAASGLYAVLHHTGGKVGAAVNWRKSVEDTLQFAWNAYSGLRTTYAPPGQGSSPASQDPLISVPLNLDRLKAAVKVLSDLLHTSTPRSVVVPVGSIVRLCVSLLSCTAEGETESLVDHGTRFLESSAVPRIQTLGCALVQSLAKCAREALTPHATQLYYCIAQHLEQKLIATQRLSVLGATAALLEYCPGLTDPQLPSRILRAILPGLAVLLAPQTEIQKEGRIDDHATKSRKGKKRARGYEGDELFKANREILCATEDDGKVVLATVKVTQRILEICTLSPSVQSLAGRMLLALFTALPHIPPGLLSQDPALHEKLYEALQRACFSFASGTTSNMSKSLGLFAGSAVYTPGSSDIWRDVDLMLHPRAPPLVRSLPHVEALSLFQVEESREELETRSKMGIVTLDEVVRSAPATTDIASTHVSTAAYHPPTPPPPAAPIPEAGMMPSPFATTPQPQAIATPNPAIQYIASPVQHDSLVPGDSTPPTVPRQAFPQEVRASAVESSAVAGPSTSAPQTTAVATVQTQHVQPVAMEMEEDADEVMPGIDMGSDSDF